MKTIYLFDILLFVAGSLYSQDTIKTGGGETILAKVIEVSQNEVRYKKFSNPSGPEYVANKSDISSIHYLNGEVDTFPIVTTTITVFSNGTLQTFTTVSADGSYSFNSTFTSNYAPNVTNANYSNGYANSNYTCNTRKVTGGDLVVGFLDLLLKTSGNNKTCTNKYSSPTWCNKCHCRHR